LVGFRDDLFDTVTAFQVIEHIDDDELFMKEIYRVLKPGGKAILTTPNIKYSLTRNPWHVREYTAEGLEKLFRKYFDKVETYGLTGNEKVMEYYEHNKQVVKSITKYDFLKLQYRLPRWVLQIPYEMANRLSRNKLLKRDQKLVSNISVKDFYLTKTPDTSLDLYYVVTK
ncbi:methyltransferase domain-containing protein, partial [bacterium]